MLRIGIAGLSDIARRRFIPALRQSKTASLVAIAVASYSERDGRQNRQYCLDRAADTQAFAQAEDVVFCDSFSSLFALQDIDAVYLPLPPALHKKWALLAMSYGKHVLLEKPFTESFQDTQELIAAAQEKSVVVFENYAFRYHAQLRAIDHTVESGLLGDIRLIRANFSFPYRGNNDFRYYKEKGGGAVLDCGGYPVCAAVHYLGESARVVDSFLMSSHGHDVDTYGCATLRSATGLTAQIAFGMDNTYRCDIDILGAESMLHAGRIFTPSSTEECVISIQDSKGNNEELIVPADDQFRGAIDAFSQCISRRSFAKKEVKRILQQAKLIDQLRIQASRNAC